MGNIFNYINEYGNITFKDKPFNEIDNLIFSSLAYLNFTNTSINENKYTLEYIGREYLNKNSYYEVKKRGIPQDDGYSLLKRLVTKERYKNIILSDFIYKINQNMQFGAITFHISKKLMYICFEGTDELISGWKEDGHLACFFPVPAQIEAINYVNKNISLFGKTVILGGHSKGGNLALVAGMYLKRNKQIKIKKIYSNDGPGLRKREFSSKEYFKIKKKYIHIVPDASVVGMLLRHDKHQVVKSKVDGILAHSMYNWVINDDKLYPSYLSTRSKSLEKNLLAWLDKHDDQERVKIINSIFKIFEDNHINNTNEIRKIKNIIKIVYSIKNIDKQTRDTIKELIDCIKG